MNNKVIAQVQQIFPNHIYRDERHSRRARIDEDTSQT
jgi:hypothetical protein